MSLRVYTGPHRPEVLAEEPPPAARLRQASQEFNAALAVVMGELEEERRINSRLREDLRARDARIEQLAELAAELLDLAKGPKPAGDDDSRGNVR